MWFYAFSSFFNSAFALLGHFKGAYVFDPHLFYWVIGVVLGGFVGSHLGAKKLSTQAITLCLFVVLMSAGIKFTFIDYFKK